MSVSLYAAGAGDDDAESYADISNGTWQRITQNVPGVAPWNGHHDPVTYTPEQLRAIAATLTGEDERFFKEPLIELADAGGAVLG